MKTGGPSNKSNSSLVLPWFLSRKTHRKVHELLPQIYRKRLHKYFQLYGCIRCQRKNRLYYSNGLCRNCSSLLSARLQRCDRLMADEYREATMPPQNLMLKKISCARSLLADLARTKRSTFRRRENKSDPPQPITLRIKSSGSTRSCY